MINTHEGALAHEHALDHGLEFFSKAGSLYDKTNTATFYGGEETALSLFQKTWIVNKEESMKLLLWLRDCRGGAGNRSGFRACLGWLASHDPEWIKVNIDKIPEVGRWDDLKVLYTTKLQTEAAKLWAKSLQNGDVLAAKWADRSDKFLQKELGVNEADLRKMLAALRQQHIVEAKMCSNEWMNIAYKTVPSVAMSRYSKTFGKHDPEGFGAYKEALVKGTVEIHADTLFPHDCVRTCLHGDTAIADAQFNALPNFIPEDERIIVIADTSGSMDQLLGKSKVLQAVHVSQGMALYCSAKLSQTNPFYKKFIGFCHESKFVDWREHTFSSAVHDYKIFNHAVGSTRIDVALDSLLNTAKFYNVPQEMMPTTLLIVSDMQFTFGARTTKTTEVKKCMNLWVENGYKVPKIVYWNTAGYAGQPDTVKGIDVGLISGFSPAILKSVFSCSDFSPRGIMLKTLEKYNINIPE